MWEHAETLTECQAVYATLDNVRESHGSVLMPKGVHPQLNDIHFLFFCYDKQCKPPKFRGHAVNAVILTL